MRIQFLGANRQVTGSRHCLEAGGLRMLVDCGMFQERQFLDRNWDACPVAAKSIDVLLLTHAHLDHCGLVPKLVRDGFRGRIVTTPPTVELAEIVMRDAAKIQEEDAAYKRKRHEREGRKGPHPVVPLYTSEDVDPVMPLFQQVEYGQDAKLNDHVTATFHDAGHILGSAMLELKVRENGTTRHVVFSGDLGQGQRPIIRDPVALDQADVLVMESTYGDRQHPDFRGVEPQLAAVIHEAVNKGGNVVIPTFAIERAQELLYYLGRLRHAERIPDVKVFLDSPMAIDVTDVFRRHCEYFDKRTATMILRGNSPFAFSGLKLVRSVEDSKAINRLRDPAIIMAGNGMCTGGRIKHHLRQNITRHESTICFVGYQGNGTLGRLILDGHPKVRIHGTNWPVNAHVTQIQGLSAHADLGAMMQWLGHFRTPPKRTFLTHGEEDSSLHFAGNIERELGWTVDVPEYQQAFDLE